MAAIRADETMLDISVSANARTLYKLPMLAEGFKAAPIGPGPQTGPEFLT